MTYGKTLAWLLAMFLLFAANHVRAESPAEDTLGWDCWIEDDNDNPVSISCIRDRGKLPFTAYPEDELETMLLNNIHYRIHSGDTTELGAFIRKYIDVFRAGDIWSIDIHLLPFNSSWEEERPQMLVRALLCPGHIACEVNIRRPPEPPPPETPAAPLRHKKQRIP